MAEIIFQGLQYENWSQACLAFGITHSAFRYYVTKGMSQAEALTHLFLIKTGVKKKKVSINIQGKEFDTKKEVCKYFNVCRTAVSNTMYKNNISFEDALDMVIQRKKTKGGGAKCFEYYQPQNIGVDYFLYKHKAPMSLTMN